MKAILKVFAIAFIGAIVFDFFHLPIPWLLGPIFTVLLSQFVVHSDFAWPPILRNTGLVIVGVAIGQQFDLSLFNGMGKLIIYMFVINGILLLCSVFLSIFISKWTDMTLKTSLTGSIPGGLSQLVLFAEEEQDIDLATVTFFHVVRVVAIVLVIPVIISGQVVTGGANDGVLSGSLVIVLILAACSVWLGKKCRLPVAHFLTPILFIIIVHLAGVETPTVPPSLLHVAQLLIGAYIGLLLKPHMIRLPKRVLAAGVMSAVALIGLTYGSSVLLQWSLGYSFATSFLSTAPGGLDQMGLLAAAVGADISIAVCFFNCFTVAENCL